MTKDNKPYGSVRYKEIVEEIFYLTKHTHVTYNDVLNMSPLERRYLLEFLIKDFKRNKEVEESARQRKKQ